MSFLQNYFNYYVYGTEEKKEAVIEKEVPKKYLISINDLKSVNLNPVKDIIPGPSRNMPPMFDKVDLRNLNKAQLDAILSVKLKPTPPIVKKVYYEPRHPVIRELHLKYKLFDFLSIKN